MSEIIKKRPKHLDLMKIKLPLPGLVSILHRISGSILFLFFIPALLWALSKSLASPDSFQSVIACLSHPVAKLVTLVFVWAYLHHFCAGIRHLLMDVHKGIDLPSARLSAKIVMGVSILLTILVGVKLW